MRAAGVGAGSHPLLVYAIVDAAKNAQFLALKKRGFKATRQVPQPTGAAKPRNRWTAPRRSSSRTASGLDFYRITT